MGTSQNILFLLLIPCAVGYKTIATENLTVEYADPKYIEITTQVYTSNQSTAVNVIFTMKINLPESTKISLKVLKWVTGHYYPLPLIQLERTLKNVLEMEMFDMQSIWVHYARPPIVWPIKKDMTYRLEHWIPDSTKFPPLSEGQYKFILTELFANKTKTVVLNWFASIKSK